MSHVHVSFQSRILEDKRRVKRRFFIAISITTELFNAENFNDITEGKEKGEAETYAMRFMDRARNYDWNAADRFIANDRSTNRSARTRGVRERRSSIRISNGARCVCAPTACQKRVAVLLDRVGYKYCSRIPWAFFRNVWK